MYVSGKNVATEILKKNKKVYKAIICNEFNDNFIISALQKNKIRIVYKTKRQIDELAKGKNQGIILDVPDFEYTLLEDIQVKSKYPFYVILDHIEDPHNLGAIIRTVEAAGVDAVILPKDRSVSINSTVMSTSSGALDNVSVVQVTNLNQTIKKLKKEGFWIVGSDMDGTDYNKIDYNMPICLIIGNEGNGMSRIIKESCDFIATIPMKGEINSLNASVAAGILIYGILNTRRS